jgi:hypothetical protein
MIHAQKTSQAKEARQTDLEIEITLLNIDRKCSNGISSATPQPGFFLGDRFAGRPVSAVSRSSRNAATWGGSLQFRSHLR